MAEPTSAQDLVKGRHFDQEIIILCVRWYLAFKLSSRDLVQMMAERGILLAHTTILRWVQQYVPEFEKRWNHYARPVSDSWRVDETYIKVRGEWVYLYRAVDKEGRTVDFLLSRQRDIAAAKRFFSRAVKYVPQYGGFCSYGVANGVLANIEGPDAFTVYKGKLYFCGNQTALKSFKSDIDSNIEKADTNWRQLTGS